VSTALLTDHYELTMLDAALRDGTAHRPCVFEAFARGLPPAAGYGVVAGLGRCSTRSRRSASTTTLGYLDDHDVVSPRRSSTCPGWSSPARSTPTPRASCTSPTPRC
jgi:nicotinate phosphoribosyltransferase